MKKKLAVMIHIFQYTDLEFICKKTYNNFCLLFQKILALKVMMHMCIRKTGLKQPEKQHWRNKLSCQ